jgi:hypothetical protein
MTGVEGIRSAFLETSTVISYILSRIKAERLGKVKLLTPDTIDEGLKFWLFNRGFTSMEQISELEKLSGTLSRGILVVLHGRAKLARDGLINPNSRWRRLHSRLGPFDPETYPLARAFYAKLASATDSEVLAQCASDIAVTDVVANEEHGDMIFEEDSTDCSSATEDDMCEEPLMGDLAVVVDPAVINSITNGDNYPLANMFKAENRNYQRISRGRRTQISGVSDWTLERSRYETTPYTYILPKHTLYRERRIHVGTCRILFSKDLRVKDDTINIWIEIRPPGDRHPNHYATEALPIDPAIRLAFLVVFTDASTQQEVQKYAFFKTYSGVCRANTFVDRIYHEKTDMEVMYTPRRYIELQRLQKLQNPGQETLATSGFTDDLLGLSRGEDEDEDEDEAEAEAEAENEVSPRMEE